MAAALSAAENGIEDILLLERGPALGGILNQCIHTGFGLKYFKEDLTGPEYAGRFMDKVIKTPQIEVSLRSFVVRLDANKKLTYLKPGALVELLARALILATGCRERTREMIHIPGTRPSGIFPAGLAQQMINIEGLMPGNEVVIIGSGDIGLIMARRFTLEGAKVKAVIEIQDKPQGLPRNLVQCLEDFGIPLFLRHKVVRVLGKDRVEGLEVVQLNAASKEIESTRQNIPCDTLLTSVGLIPENELLKMAGAAVPGIFVCGNAYKVYDIVDKVTTDSMRAGKLAAEYLTKK
jgi:NADPH-dependent 2,4-dienoyl-CoA reductase/sulfur reductase-like enzyme